MSSTVSFLLALFSLTCAASVLAFHGGANAQGQCLDQIQCTAMPKEGDNSKLSRRFHSSTACTTDTQTADGKLAEFRRGQKKGAFLDDFACVDPAHMARMGCAVDEAAKTPTAPPKDDRHQFDVLETLKLPQPEQPQKPQLPKCTPNFKFERCCRQIGSGLDDEILNKLCTYPPQEISTGEAMALTDLIGQYIQCLADVQDNSECCARSGVPNSAGLFGIGTTNCRDFCDGTVLHPFQFGYVGCLEHMDAISSCNERAVDMQTDTAMRRLGTCWGEDCWEHLHRACDAGDWWKNK